MNSLRLCLVQMNSANEHKRNIESVSKSARQAAEEGCDLLALPEVSGLLNRNPEEVRSLVTIENRDPFIQACRQLASSHGIWIHIGTTPVLEGRKLYNRTLLFDSDGLVRARYDKIHLFDAKIGTRSTIRESDTYTAGKKAVIAVTPWGLWGLTICYDLRFPGLYWKYAKAGTQIIFVPSAFTIPTGKAHWEPLLRARAIETGCWIIAAAQVGHHDDGRKTYGHTMIIDPWGCIFADLGGSQTGTIVIDLDLTLVEEARKKIPSLDHDRIYTPTQVF